MSLAGIRIRKMVTPRMGLCVATALWIQHIAVKSTVADMPSSRMTT